MNTHIPIDIDTPVWVLHWKLPVVISAKVSRQEWWRSANPDHPVYYDLKTLDGQHLDCPGSGNWHFQEVYLSELDAEQKLQSMLNHGWYSNQYFDWKHS